MTGLMSEGRWRSARFVEDEGRRRLQQRLDHFGEVGGAQVDVLFAQHLTRRRAEHFAGDAVSITIER